MNMRIEKVILSTDSSSKFVNFWPIAAASWLNIMRITPTLAFLVRNESDQKLISRLQDYGEVVPVYSFSKAPVENQGKMARWYVASQQRDLLTTTDDIDSIFLNNTYFCKKMESLDPATLLGIGSEVYSGVDAGKFPASNLTGKGSQFADLFHYDFKMDFDAFLNQFKSTMVIDGRENPFNKPRDFSDESLIRSLAQKNQIKVIRRDLDTKSDWLDRLNWPTPLEAEHLVGIQIVNFPRPLYENRKEVKPILDIFFPDGYPWLLSRQGTLRKLFRKLNSSF